MKKFSFTLIMLLLVQTASARKFGSTSSGSSSDTMNNPTVSVPGTTVAVGNSDSCELGSDGVDDSGDAISLEFLKVISFNPSAMKIYSTSDGLAVVDLPDMVSGPCLKLSIDAKQIGGKLFIRFKNTAAKLDKDKSLAMGERYFKCMEAEGLITDGNIDKDEAKAKGYVKRRKQVIRGNYKKGHYSVVVASPAPGDFDVINPVKVSSSPSDWKCLGYGKINKKTSNRLLSLDEQRAEDHVYRICSAGDVEEMLSFRSDLSNSSLRNASRLKDIIDGILKVSSKKDGKDILKQMKNIEKELSGKDLDEESAAEYAEEYVKLAKLYEQIIIDPLSRQVDDLLKKRKGTSKKEKKSIDKRIGKLNKQIRKFAEHWGMKKNKGARRRVEKALKKFGLMDEGAEINLVFLKSRYMSRVYKGSIRGLEGKLKRSAANKKIEKDDERFREYVIPIWDDYYAAHQGDKEPIERRQRQIRSLQQSMYTTGQTFQKNEVKYQQKYCGNSFGFGPANPTKCQQFMSERNTRMNLLQRKLVAMEGGLNGMKASYGEMMSGYNQYLYTQSQEEGFNDDPYNAFRLYGDPFSSLTDSQFALYGNDPRRQQAGRQPALYNPGSMGYQSPGTAGYYQSNGTFGFGQDPRFSGGQFGGGMPQQYGMPMQQFGQPYNPQMGFQPQQQQNFGGGRPF